MPSDLGIRYYIAVHGGFEEDGSPVWDFVEDFSTERAAKNRVSFYERQGKVACVVPAKLVPMPEPMVQ